MAYKTSFGFTDTQDNQKDFNEKFKSIDTGPYIGQVKYNVDPLRMYRSKSASLSASKKAAPLPCASRIYLLSLPPKVFAVRIPAAEVWSLKVMNGSE